MKFNWKIPLIAGAVLLSADNKVRNQIQSPTTRLNNLESIFEKKEISEQDALKILNQAKQKIKDIGFKYDVVKFNCLDFSLKTIEIAKENGLETHLIQGPDHFFLEYKGNFYETTDLFAPENPMNKRNFDREENLNEFHDAEFYIKGLKISEKALENGCYMQRLTETQIDALSLIVEAYDFESKGRPDLAMSKYNESMKLYPNNPKVYTNRAIILSNKGEYDLAIQDCNKAIELDPNFTSAYVNRAYLFLKEKKSDLAIQDCNKAIELDSNETSAYINRAMNFLDKKDYDLAIQDCNKAIELEPTYNVNYYNRATVFLEKEDYNSSIQDYSKAIELGLDYYEVYCNRGRAYEKIGEIEKAENDLRKCEESYNTLNETSPSH